MSFKSFQVKGKKTVFALPSQPFPIPPSGEESRPSQLWQGQWFGWLMSGIWDLSWASIIVQLWAGSPHSHEARGLSKSSFHRPSTWAQRELFFPSSKGVTVLQLACWTRLTRRAPRCQTMQKHNEWATGKSVILYFYKHHFFLASTSINHTRYEPLQRRDDGA